MFRDSFLFARTMGCFGCFGTSGRTRQSPKPYDDDRYSSGSDVTSTARGEEEDDEEEVEQKSRSKRSEEILKYRLDNGLICRHIPVRETNELIRGEDENGDKTINEYVRICKIGSGTYGKVVLYRSTVDGKYYAIKAFHKSHLLRLRVAPSETAMSDVLREVMIMKILEHPNIVNLIEVIDDPEFDHFYMVLEYVDGKWVYDGSGPPGALGEKTARKYLRDIVTGLMYLHAHDVIHGDIKPDNLLVTSSGTVKIGDFGVSQVFKVQLSNRYVRFVPFRESEEKSKAPKSADRFIINRAIFFQHHTELYTFKVCPVLSIKLPTSFPIFGQTTIHNSQGTEQIELRNLFDIQQYTKLYQETST